MLKLIRYILLRCNEYSKNKAHMAELHKINADDLIGISMWHCKGWLMRNESLGTSERIDSEIKTDTYNVGVLLSITKELSVCLSKTGSGRYISDLPDWRNRDINTVSLDRWLVDDDGYYIDMREAVEELYANLSIIHTTLKGEEYVDLVYHYQKKPKGVYLSILSFIKQFS